eukprot:3608761-Rhodomonas_salina.1
MRRDARVATPGSERHRCCEFWGEHAFVLGTACGRVGDIACMLVVGIARARVVCGFGSCSR